MGVRFERSDRWGNRLGPVHTPLSAVHEEGVDGTDCLTIETFDDLQKGDRIVWDDADTGTAHEHEVVETTRTHDGSGRPVTRATCMNSVCELFGDDLSARTYTNQTLSQIMTDVLRNTRWQYHDSPDFQGRHTIELSDTSVREAVAQIAEAVGAEMRATSTGAHPSSIRVIYFHREIRSSAVTGRFTYSRNMGRVVREVSADEVYTGVRGIGAQVQGSSAHYTETVYSTSALAAWGRPDRDGNRVHRVCRLSDPSCESVSAIRVAAADHLAQVCQPKVTYTCEIADIGNRRLGDLVSVVDTGFEPALRTEARITSITRDLLGRTRGGRVVIGSRPPSYMRVAFESIAGRTFDHHVR